jgi:GNAT superfamily N-acetyltransferase
MQSKNFKIQVANATHLIYAEEICRLMEESARIRGTGIAKRSPDYIKEKMMEGKAVVATYEDKIAGFCYIESWGHGKYVANSGLIVAPDYRKSGIARNLKRKTFQLSRKKFPEAKLFGITTSLAVMKINSDLGYRPVTFSELTDDDEFWKGCSSCRNYDILLRNERRMCLCTAMLYDPKAKNTQKLGILEHLSNFKDSISSKVQQVANGLKENGKNGNNSDNNK